MNRTFLSAVMLLTLFVFYEVLSVATYPLVTHAGTDQARRAGRLYLGLLMGTSIGFLLFAILWWFSAKPRPVRTSPFSSRPSCGFPRSSGLCRVVIRNGASWRCSTIRATRGRSWARPCSWPDPRWRRPARSRGSRSW